MWDESWNGREGGGRPPQARGLLGAGWRPLNRAFDLEYFWHLALNDGGELAQKTLDFASDLANTLGRTDHAWWANLLNVFGEGMKYEVDEFWHYLTPEPPAPDYRYKDVLSCERPIVQAVSRDSIPIDYVLGRLREIIIQRVLAHLGRPDLITQYYMDRHFYYPLDRFTGWERLEVPGVLYAYWRAAEVWLCISPSNENRGRQFYTLIARDLAPLINKVAYDLGVMLSGYQSRIGQIQSPFAVTSFPAEVRAFTDAVQQAVLERDHLAVLVHGVPGTGKTAWTQAVAREILMPLGYVVFILDHDAVENFVPPTYLERICLIVNEADNLARDRGSEAAQANSRTEHVLGLLDGTLYQSVIEEGGIQNRQKLVVLLTCNTTERLDPAMLRKGRVDLICEFNHRFV
jgi:hypothetical protein